jgi:hypothetical protein
MKLVDLALVAALKERAEAEDEYTDNVKRQARVTRNQVEITFGVPFCEAFDTKQVAIQNEGRTLRVANHIYLHYDEEGLEVEVYHPVTSSFVGRRRFNFVTEHHHEANLLLLGRLLAKAYLERTA